MKLGERLAVTAAVFFSLLTSVLVLWRFGTTGLIASDDVAQWEMDRPLPSAWFIVLICSMAVASIVALRRKRSRIADSVVLSCSLLLAGSATFLLLTHIARSSFR